MNTKLSRLVMVLWALLMTVASTSFAANGRSQIPSNRPMSLGPRLSQLDSSDMIWSGTRTFMTVNGCSAFVVQPPRLARDGTRPWAWYAPTFTGLQPDVNNSWLFERLIQNGFWVVGVDVGESYGSPAGRRVYSAFYDTLISLYNLNPRACFVAQSRGGLMAYNWAADSGNEQKVSRLAGIYPVGDLVSYPGLDIAAPAYNMTPQELQDSLVFNDPIDRLAPLAAAGVKIFHVHGDADSTAPLAQNSQVIYDRYTTLGGMMTLIIIPGEGHNTSPLFFQSLGMLDFLLAELGPPPTGAIDGILDSAYTQHHAVDMNQRIQTGAGDAKDGRIDLTIPFGSELDQMYGYIYGDTLHLFIAGNLASDCTKLHIFLDTGQPGQNRLRGDNTGLDYDALNVMGDDGSGNGLQFDSSFTARHWFEVYGCRPDTAYFLGAIYAELLPDGHGGQLSLGSTTAGSDGTLLGGDTQAVRLSIHNSNTHGVTAGCDSSSGAAVTTGIEMAIPLDLLGNPAGDIKVCTFLTTEAHDIVYNQVLGSLPPGTCNLGDPRLVNFAAISGDQFLTVGPDLTAAPETHDGLSGQIQLYPVRPNPSIGGATLSFSLPKLGNVTLGIYDLLGRRVKQWHWPVLTASVHHVSWDGRDDNGRTVAPGVLFYRLTVGNQTHKQKLIHLQ